MIADSADIRFECDKCGQHLVVEAAAAGLTMDCPICSTSVTVPKKGPQTVVKAPAAEAKAHFADPGAEILKDELIDASLSNGKLLADLEKSRAEMARAQQQLRELNEEHERLNASATHAQRELKTFQTERQQLKGEAAGLRQRLAEAEQSRSEVEALRRELADSSEALGQTRTLLAASEEALALSHQSATEIDHAHAAEVDHRRSLQEKIAQLEARLADALAGLEERDAEIVATRDIVAEQERERGELKAHLDDASQQLVVAAETARKLADTEAALRVEETKLAAELDLNRALTARCEKLCREAEALKNDLRESATGREIIENREQMERAFAERDRSAQRVEAVEAEMRKLTASEEALRAERDEALRARNTVREEVVTLRDSRTVKDNEILRGIVARLNAENLERSAEVLRLRRAQHGMKIVYALFGLGFLALVAFALKVLPHAAHW